MVMRMSARGRAVVAVRTQTEGSYAAARAVRRLKRVSSHARVGQYMHRFGCFISRLRVINFGRGCARRRRERCCTASLQCLCLGRSAYKRWNHSLQPMRCSSEELMPIPGEQRVRFCLALGNCHRLGTAASAPGESPNSSNTTSSRSWRSLQIRCIAASRRLVKARRPSQNELSSSRIPSVASD